jgi:hypothetical protein
MAIGGQPEPNEHAEQPNVANSAMTLQFHPADHRRGVAGQNRYAMLSLLTARRRRLHSLIRYALTD